MNSGIKKVFPFNFNLISQLQLNFKIVNENGMRHKINILFCDIQHKYIKKIANHKEIIQKAKTIAEISKALKFNNIITEQKRDIFGNTIQEIISNLDNSNYKIIEKSRFSMFSDEEIEKLPLDDVFVLLGIEAHICVYQTALNLIKNNRYVIILADSVSSSNLGERKIALHNLRDMGCYITTTQGLFFLMLQDSKDENFTLLLKYLKDLSSIPANLLLSKEDGKNENIAKF